MSRIFKNETGTVRIWITIIIVLVLIGAAGFYVIKNRTSREASTSNSQVKSQQQPLEKNLDGLLAFYKIKSLAAKEKSGAVVSQVGLVQTASGPTYHVELKDGDSIDFDAKTGSKISNAGVKDYTDGDHLPAGFTPAIGFAYAGQTARKQITGGSITRIELEAKDNTAVYNVQFSTGEYIVINAATGAVIISVAQIPASQPSTDTSGNDPSNGTQNTPSSSSTDSSADVADGNPGEVDQTANATDNTSGNEDEASTDTINDGEGYWIGTTN